MKVEDWSIERETGYKPITTFYKDFSIAEKFGGNAVIETYNRMFNEWKSDYKYLTELVMVLNWKIWRYYEDDRELAELYNDLWQKTDLYATDNLKGKELSYFYKTTD